MEKLNVSTSFMDKSNESIINVKKNELDNELRQLRATIDSTNRILTKVNSQSSVLFHIFNVIFTK